MASPHVAGLGAYLLGVGDIAVADLCDFIKLVAIENVIEKVPSDTLDLLAYNGAEGPSDYKKTSK
jgi:cerevisin